jgi:hypothetical protein
MKMRLRITTLLLEPYCEYCLPETVKLSRIRAFKKLIESDPKFLKLPNDWEFGDKLLAFLVPYFKKDIKNYLSGSGDGMINMFTEIQLKSLDRELFNLLKGYLKQKDENFFSP